MTAAGGASRQGVSLLSQLIWNKGCSYVDVGGTGMTDQGDQSKLVELISDAVDNIRGKDLVADIEPIILVLDFAIQMLPWENLPVLRENEVYRMPSVSSVSSTLDRCCARENSTVFPVIDPRRAYYLLNPDGDPGLIKMETQCLEFLKNKKLKGTSGTRPTPAELIVALKNHELFIYIGHGSGQVDYHIMGVKRSRNWMGVRPLS